MRLPRLVAIVLSAACLVPAQQKLLSPAFEAASVKPSDPKLGRQMFPVRGGPGSADPDRVAYTNITLGAMLYYAYGVAGTEIAGPPAVLSAISSGRFDIEAKAAPGTTKEQFTLMLRNLLAERFHLVVHHEAKETDGYNLVVARNGPNLKQSLEADVIAASEPHSGSPLPGTYDSKGYPQPDRPGMIYPPVPGSNGNAMHLIARAQVIPDLARILSGLYRHPIVDKTGLTARYDFTLEFALESLAPTDATDDLPPRIPVALEEQLGLKLEPTKVPVDLLVVDSADKVPTEN